MKSGCSVMPSPCAAEVLDEIDDRCLDRHVEGDRRLCDASRANVAGSMLPGFPNFFMIYGPNTNPGNGGGIVNHEEVVTRFALECFEHLILNDKQSVDVTTEAFDRYNRELDAREALKIYTDKRSASFYVKT